MLRWIAVQTHKTMVIMHDESSLYVLRPEGSGCYTVWYRAVLNSMAMVGGGCDKFGWSQRCCIAVLNCVTSRIPKRKRAGAFAFECPKPCPLSTATPVRRRGLGHGSASHSFPATYHFRDADAGHPLDIRF